MLGALRHPLKLDGAGPRPDRYPRHSAPRAILCYRATMLVEDLVARGRYHINPSSVEHGGWRGRSACSKAAWVSAFCSRRVGELSGGQRVWIAMALAQSTDVLLLTYLGLNHQLEGSAGGPPT